MKKTCKLHLGLTTEQKTFLKKEAEKFGLTLASYCLLILMTTQLKQKEIIKVDERKIKRLLK